MQAPILIAPRLKAPFVRNFANAPPALCRCRVKDLRLKTPIPAKSTPPILPARSPPPAIVTSVRWRQTLSQSTARVRGDEATYHASQKHEFPKHHDTQPDLRTRL